jgi:hypothetical protein
LAPLVLFEPLEEEVAEMTREFPDFRQNQSLATFPALGGVPGRPKSRLDRCDNRCFLFGQLLVGPVEAVQRAFGGPFEFRLRRGRSDRDN